MNKTEGQICGFSDIKDNISKRIGAGVLATTLMVGGVGFRNKNARAEESNPSNIETAGIMPSQIEAPTLAYAKRLQKIEKLKEELVNKECKPENLDFCARVLYAVDESPGFFDSVMLPNQEKTILKNYLDRNKVIQFGKKGKGLDVIYFKDEKGKKTNIPALCYVGASDWNVGIKQVQGAIDKWEKVSPGFLRWIYANDVCLFFQTDASDEKASTSFRYGKGIVLFNCNLKNKKEKGSSDFSHTIQYGFGLEPFGNRLEELSTEYLGGTGAVIKQLLAYDCGSYINLSHPEFVMYRDYKRGADFYIQLSGSSPEKINDLIAELKANKWVIPYGAKTWEEINSVVDPKHNIK